MHINVIMLCVYIYSAEVAMRNQREGVAKKSIQVVLALVSLLSI